MEGDLELMAEEDLRDLNLPVSSAWKNFQIPIFIMCTHLPSDSITQHYTRGCFCVMII